MYLDKFVLPSWEAEESLMQYKYDLNGTYLDNIYPCRIFAPKYLEQIDFEKITIIYGGNGSGKSTLLNLIANKLRLDRVAPFNDSELFQMFVDRCKYLLGCDDYGYPTQVPAGSRIITSDDVFDYMLAVRTNNADIAENIEYVKTEQYPLLKYGPTVRMTGMEDYEHLRLQVLSRKKSLSRRQFLRQTVGREAELHSNGETALRFFETKLSDNHLYCLDEPENSLSPKLQQQLVEHIEMLSKYGCQFIIATHSPFILAIKDAKIYDLDANPVSIKQWWELEHCKMYFEFFDKFRGLFLSVK